MKHLHGYSSVGLTPESRVEDREALHREAARFIEAYGSALVEEFIEGREFTVLVAEPRGGWEEAWGLQPVEFIFPEGESFKHFDLKWKDYDRMQTCAVTEEPLTSGLREASVLTFAALGGSGYGRCDRELTPTAASICSKSIHTAASSIPWVSLAALTLFWRTIPLDIGAFWNI